MTKRIGRAWRTALALACATALSVAPARGDETYGAPLTGIDHLQEDYLSVSNFSVNGAGGAQAGQGGSMTCCVAMPEKWRPGLTARVKWDVSDWKDSGHGGRYEADVPVEPYTAIGRVWLHFLADGSVRVVVSDYGPRNPHYPGPHDPIPRKQPWKDYPPRSSRDGTVLQQLQKLGISNPR